VVRWRWLK